MIYRAKSNEIDVPNYIRQFQDGLITLSELVHKLNICSICENIMLYAEIGQEKKLKSELKKLEKENKR